MDPVAHVLEAPLDPAPIASLEDAFARVEAAAAPFDSTGARALVAGACADRLGYAFVGGYQAALASLVAPRPSARASLCATEDGGAHPRAIRTRLERVQDAWLLTGTKTFATLATAASVLYVVASEGERDGRNALRLVAISARAPGVTIAPRAEIAFAPEIPHARVVLDRVAVADADVLPGDGYARYLKPFRTVEDAHVFLATLGYLVRLARVARWPTLDALASHARALLDVAASDPSTPATHLELARIIDAVRAIVDALDWSAVDEPTRARWERDRALLWVAEQARQKRTEAALAASGQKRTEKPSS